MATEAWMLFRPRPGLEVIVRVAVVQNAVLEQYTKSEMRKFELGRRQK